METSNITPKNIMLKNYANPMLIVALFLPIALISCEKLSSNNTPTTPLSTPHKLVVAYTLQPQSTLVHIAMANGYFLEEGLEIQPAIHTYGKAALQAVIDHKADFATVAETPVMFSVLKGEKIAVIANIEASSMNNAVVGRKDAGIVKPADLKGKRIGFTPGTTSDFFLDSLLTANGMVRKDIVPVALKPEEMQNAVMTKQVDAVSTWNYPVTQIHRQLGSEGTVIYDREIYTETYNVAAQQKFIKDNPETVERFLRALVKAENFVAKNPDAAQTVMAAATKIDKGLIREVWDSFHYHVVLDETLLITLEDETRWALKNKLTDQTAMPNYLHYIHIDSLRAVKPEAIRLNR